MRTHPPAPLQNRQYRVPTPRRQQPPRRLPAMQPHTPPTPREYANRAGVPPSDRYFSRGHEIGNPPSRPPPPTHGCHFAMGKCLIKRHCLIFKIMDFLISAPDVCHFLGIERKRPLKLLLAKNDPFLSSSRRFADGKGRYSCPNLVTVFLKR